jgi:uncharacterized membrane-anchored protein YitT (DUF2179 family)
MITLINRTDVPRITAFIRAMNPGAFFSIEGVRYVNKGVFRLQEPGVPGGIIGGVLHRKKK